MNQRCSKSDKTVPIPHATENRDAQMSDIAFDLSLVQLPKQPSYTTSCTEQSMYAQTCQQPPVPKADTARGRRASVPSDRLVTISESRVRSDTPVRARDFSRRLANITPRYERCPWVGPPKPRWGRKELVPICGGR